MNPEPDAVTQIAALHLSDSDNVVVATETVEPGQSVLVPGGSSIVARDPIPAGHKLAVAEIRAGQPVIKFGVEIGTASQDICVGNHVHVHNLESDRMRGDRG
jgi:SAF domain